MPYFAAGIHQNSSTDDVRVQENLRVFDGAVYMALCCEVYHHIRMLLLEELVNCFSVAVMLSCTKRKFGLSMTGASVERLPA